MPPYFMQIIDLETQYAYKKNNLSIQCEQTRPRILISNFQPINQSTNQGLRSTAVPTSKYHGAWAVPRGGTLQ